MTFGLNVVGSIRLLCQKWGYQISLWKRRYATIIFQISQNVINKYINNFLQIVCLTLYLRPYVYTLTDLSLICWTDTLQITVYHIMRLYLQVQYHKLLRVQYLLQNTFSLICTYFLPSVYYIIEKVMKRLISIRIKNETWWWWKPQNLEQLESICESHQITNVIRWYFSHSTAFLLWFLRLQYCQLHIGVNVYPVYQRFVDGR